MKKIFKILALPVFAVAFAFTLASCDQYAGNYQEANEEQITEFKQKVSDAQAEQQENKKNVEVSANMSGNVSGSGYSANLSFNLDNVVDSTSDETKTLTYTSCNYNMNISAQGVSGNVKLNYELWTDDTTGYLKAKTSGTGMDNEVKIKGSLNGSSFSEYTSMVAQYKTMAEKYDIQTVVEQLNKNGAKIYVDGDNKLKLDFVEQNVQVYIYVIFNEDKTYSMKIDMPEFNYSTSGMGMKMKMTVEIKPTGKKVTLPNASDFNQA